jgi:repressor of nif and glnA expression
MTRQEARAITGLSVGRIQQLIRSEGSPDREILELFVDGPVPSLEELLELADRKGANYEEDDLRQKVYHLKERGFLSDTSDKDVQLTDAGMRALLEARVLGDEAEKQE